MIGAWRETQDGEDFRGNNRPVINPAGRLPNGAEFETFDQFRSCLLDQSDRFRRGLAEKLLIYAMGRPIEPQDDATLTQAVQQMKSHGDTLRALIHALVNSRTFLNK